MEATEPIHHMKMTTILERCTADEQALQILLRDADGNELEVLKFREMKSARDIDPGEMHCLNVAWRSVGARWSTDDGSEKGRLA